MKVFRWILRVGIGMVVILCIAIGISLIRFSSWKADIVDRREADPERRIVTTTLGDIEFAVTGDGVPLLSLHGTPGGYDQSLVGIRAIEGNEPANTMTIAVSRPGYRGTPLSSGETFEEQADLFAALLDELGIDRAVVFAASGGGYAGLQFAIRHSDRTMGLILYAPEIKSELPEGIEPGGSLADTPLQVFMAEYGMWLMGSRAASFLMNELNADDPEQQAMVATTLDSTIPWGARDDGRINDLTQRMDPAIDEWPLESISAPTLILHGDADENSSYVASQDAALRIPNAELATFADGDHYIIVTRRQAVEQRIRDFTQAVASNTGSNR